MSDENTKDRPRLAALPNDEVLRDEERTPGISQRLPNGFEVPFPYELWGDGLYRVENTDGSDGAHPSLLSTPAPQRRRNNLKLITRRPIWINRYGRAIDTNEELCELAFYPVSGDRPGYLWVERQAIATRQALVRLSGEGLSITDQNVNDVLGYLDSAYYKNPDNLPSVRVASRCGAYDFEMIDRSEKFPKKRTATGWLYGKSWIGPLEGKTIFDERGNHQFATGLHTSGSAEEWHRYWTAYAGPQRLNDARLQTIRWLLNATFAAPLMRLIGTRTFFIHHWGTTGTGKTALLKLANTAWGDSQALTMHFNRTQTSFAEIFRYADGIPIAFDELQSAGRADVSALIYTFCVERGRARSTKTGGLEAETMNWRTLVRTTGEEPLIGKDGTIDLGGQTNRVIQLDAPLMPDEEASEVHRWVDQRHYGWGASRFLLWLSDLLQTADGRDLLAAQYTDFYADIGDQIRRLVKSRLGHLAVVATASYVAQRALYPEANPRLLYDNAIADAAVVASSIAQDEEAQREPISAQVLQLFRDSFHEHRNHWLDLDDPAQRKAYVNSSYASLTGVLAGDEVWLNSTWAHRLLSRAGIPRGKALNELVRSGILILTPPASRHGKRVIRKYGDSRAIRVYALKRSAFESE